MKRIWIPALLATTLAGVPTSSANRFRRNPGAQPLRGGGHANAAGNAPAAEEFTDADRALARRIQAHRRQRVSAAGRIFRRIAVDRDFAGEYVLERDARVTAFLDISDAQHPKFEADQEVEEELLARIPPNRRAHILVVPNQPREHIGATLGGRIDLRDVEATREVLAAAEALARKLGVVDPTVYVNPESRVGIGYLHAHIIGERPAKPYPAKL